MLTGGVGWIVPLVDHPACSLPPLWNTLLVDHFTCRPCFSFCRLVCELFSSQAIPPPVDRRLLTILLVNHFHLQSVLAVDHSGRQVTLWLVGFLPDRVSAPFCCRWVARRPSFYLRTVCRSFVCLGEDLVVYNYNCPTNPWDRVNWFSLCTCCPK